MFTRFLNTRFFRGAIAASALVLAACSSGGEAPAKGDDKPSINSAMYNTASGELKVTGANLSKTVTDYDVTKIVLAGKTLTTASSVTEAATGSFTVEVAGADLTSVNSAWATNKTLTTLADWMTGATAISSSVPVDPGSPDAMALAAQLNGLTASSATVIGDTVTLSGTVAVTPSGITIESGVTLSINSSGHLSFDTSGEINVKGTLTVKGGLNLTGATIAGAGNVTTTSSGMIVKGALGYVKVTAATTGNNVNTALNNLTLAYGAVATTSAISITSTAATPVGYSLSGCKLSALSGAANDTPTSEVDISGKLAVNSGGTDLVITDDGYAGSTSKEFSIKNATVTITDGTYTSVLIQNVGVGTISGTTKRSS